ncbi:hypothetical protein C4B68_26080 [Streptomyces dengpaensis]|uniref:LamG domain-containing protein n=1 Tax=Streptomyces dengpaensis TaxID=2049881 RepID=A0ABM6SVU9_9ACTN|nr:hypothetical protein C4B68_26080 [Streptomyces dengpaensis]
MNAGDSYLATTGTTTSNNGASTPDVAALDITGDIDIRFEATLSNWNAAGSVELCGKGLITGNQRSWVLMMRDERLHFEWSAAGTTTIQKDCTAALPLPPSGRLAVRVTLDVNDGAGNNVVTFYTAPSISGTWTQLGSAVTTAGTTSIFNSTAPVRAGDGWGDLAFPCSSGAVHAFELRSSIGGTVVANPNFRVQTPGATSFADGTGKTWTVGASTTITNRKARFVGEVSSWPARWDVSGMDVYVQVEAAGIMRRLGQGASPLQSTLRRRIPSFASEPLLAYWPAEEGSTATRAYSPIKGVRPLKLTPARWAAVDTLASSTALPTLNSSTTTPCELKGTVPTPAGVVTEWNVTWMYRLDTVNTTLRTFMRVLSTGTVAEWYVQTRNDLTRVLGKDSDGVTVFTNDFVTSTDLYNQWIQAELQIRTSGSDVHWAVQWTDVGGDAGQISGTFTGATGRPLAVSSPPDGYSADIDGMAIGHIAVFGSETTFAYDGAVTAWAGETAGDRLVRLTDEESVPLLAYGDGATPVGAQLPTPLLDLLGECADADHGVLYEARDSVALQYRDLAGMCNQTPALALSYTTAGHVTPPLEPVDDDQAVRNDVTVTRTGGSSARVTLDTGALSVLAPPDGVGRYDESVTLNLFEDDQADDHAGWLLWLGTQDVTRYPVLHVELSAAPSLIESVTALDLGDRITISNPPAWLPPDTIDLLMQGYTETIDQFEWGFDFNCTPARPFDVASADNTTVGKADTEGSELSVGATSTATSISVATTSGPIWTTSGAEMPFDVTVAGEVMRVTAITGAASPQTFTVTRSVNGVVKAQLAGTDVRLTHPAIVAL